MAETIRGLTIEISADAKKFNSGMNEMRRDAKQSQAELNALQKSLEIEFDADTFARAQQVAQRAIDETRANADTLAKRLEYLESIGATDTAEYKKLQTELAQTETKGKQLEQQLESINKLDTSKAQKEVKSLTQELEGAAAAAGTVAAVSTAALAAIAAMGLGAVSSADDVATLADQYGVTATQMQQLQYIAMQTDVSETALYKGLIKTRAAIADLSTGINNTASAALARLNLDLNSFDGTDEQFYAIVGALGEMENKTEAVAIANEIFGDNIANQLIPLINAGTDAIEEYSAEFSELAPLTDEQVAALAKFDNVLNRIKTQFANVRNQIGAAFLPVWERVADRVSGVIVPALQKLAEWLNTLSDRQLIAIVAILGVAAALGTLILVLPKLISGIKAIKASMLQLDGALAKLAANPVVAIIAVIAIILLVLYNTSEQFRESINRLLETLTSALAPILDLIVNLLGALIDGITPILTLIGDLLGVIINVILDALQPLFDIIEMLVGIITNLLQGALGTIINLVGVLLNALMPLIDILGSVLTVALTAVFASLTPVFTMLELIFSIIQPLIEFALIPLQLQLQMLSVPLQFLGELLGWLAPLFTKFAEFVKGKFDVVIGFVNKILKGVEDAVNWVIDKINGLIRGINNLGGWLGIHINEIQKVSMQVSIGGTGNVDGGNVDTSGAPTPNTQTPTAPTYEGGSFVYDGIDFTGGGDTYNNDYSQKEVNVTNNITIQNYAKEVDVDDLVHQINVKLAEVM